MTFSPRATQPMVMNTIRARRMEIALFFMSGVGSTLAWTAILSNLVYYTATLGKESYLYLNIAVFAPLLPVFLIQAGWDSHFDRRYGSLKSYSYRGIVGFSIVSVALGLIPSASDNLLTLSLLTLAIGVSSAVLHGTLKQMASFVYPKCGRLPAALNSGMQASAALVLIVSLSTGFGGRSDSGKSTIYQFYMSIGALHLLCWVAFQLLMFYSKDVLRCMLLRDTSFHNLESMVEVEEPLLMVDSDTGSDTGNDEVDSRALIHDDDAIDTSTNGTIEEWGDDEPFERPVRVTQESELSYKELWGITRPCCVSLMFTVGASMSVASWFNRVQSADPSNHSLPRVLFYIRLFMDFLGRPATLWIPPTSIFCVKIVTAIRFCFVPLFFVYVAAGDNILPRNDVAVIIGVALFSFTSGYNATACYQLAPDMLGAGQKGSTPKQAGLINVCFSASIVIGLGVSLVLMAAGL